MSPTAKLETQSARNYADQRGMIIVQLLVILLLIGENRIRITCTERLMLIIARRFHTSHSFFQNSGNTWNEPCSTLAIQLG